MAINLHEKLGLKPDPVAESGMRSCSKRKFTRSHWHGLLRRERGRDTLSYGTADKDTHPHHHHYHHCSPPRPAAHHGHHGGHRRRRRQQPPPHRAVAAPSHATVAGSSSSRRHIPPEDDDRTLEHSERLQTEDEEHEDGDEAAASPKKKKLKLILKLRNPDRGAEGGESAAVAAAGTRSRHNGGGSGVGSGIPGSRSSRSANGFGPSGSGTSATTTSESVEDVGVPKKRKIRDRLHKSEDQQPDSHPRRRIKEPQPTPPPVSAPASISDDETLGQLQGPQKVLAELLEKFQKKDTYSVFAEPVDPAEIPDYHEVIKEPMDFSTIKKKLLKGVYSSLELFERDVMLVCSNAMKYNAPRTVYYKQAKAIKDIARKAFDSLKGMNGHKRGPGKQTGAALRKSKRMSGVTRRSMDNSTDPTSAVTLASGDGKRPSAGDRAADMSNKANSPFQAQPNEIDALEGSVGKSISAKEARKLLTVDENRRHTYKPPGFYEDDFPTQIVPVGNQPGGAYTQSLVMFGANFNRSAWEFVARKIRKVLAPNVSFGRGWVGEEPPETTTTTTTSITNDASVPSEASKEKARDETAAADTSSTVVTPSTSGGGPASFFPGMFPASATTVGMPVHLARPPLVNTSVPCTSGAAVVSNGLFPGLDVFGRPSGGLHAPNSVKHWMQPATSAPAVATVQASRDAHRTSEANLKQSGSQHQQQFRSADQQQFRSNDGGNQQMKNAEATTRNEIFRNLEGTTQFRNAKPDGSFHGFSGSETQQQQARPSIDVNVHQGTSSRSNKDGSGVNTQQQRERPSLDAQLRSSLDAHNRDQQQRPENSSGSSQKGRHSSDSGAQLRHGVDSPRQMNAQQQQQQQQQQQLQQRKDGNTRKPDQDAGAFLGAQQFRKGETHPGIRGFPLQRASTSGEPHQESGNKFPKFNPGGGAGGNLAFPGAAEAARGVWSLQRALSHEQASRSNEAAAGFSSPFGNLAAYNTSRLGGTMDRDAGATMQTSGRDLFQASGGKVPPSGSSGSSNKLQQHQQKQQRLISDLNSRSEGSNGDFFRTHQHENHPMGVYNAISQSLLQQRLMQPPNPNQLRTLPPDLNVRLQSPKSPQHNQQQLHHLHHQLQHHQHQQQQQQQHQHQQQQQQHQQQQQPDLALQL